MDNSSTKCETAWCSIILAESLRLQLSVTEVLQAAQVKLSDESVDLACIFEVEQENYGSAEIILRMEVWFKCSS